MSNVKQPLTIARLRELLADWPDDAVVSVSMDEYGQFVDVSSEQTGNAMRIYTGQ